MSSSSKWYIGLVTSNEVTVEVSLVVPSVIVIVKSSLNASPFRVTINQNSTEPATEISQVVPSTNKISDSLELLHTHL